MNIGKKEETEGKSKSLLVTYHNFLKTIFCSCYFVVVVVVVVVVLSTRLEKQPFFNFSVSREVHQSPLPSLPYLPSRILKKL